MKSYVFITGLAACVCTAALADLPAGRAPRPELVTTQPQLILPQRVARYTADGRIGPWIEYGGGGIAQACATDVVYDSAGFGDQYNFPCDPSFSVLPDYCNNLSIDDFTVEPGATGAFCERVLFYWQQSGTSGAESQLIILTTAETVSTDCTDPVVSGDYGGVILDMGPVADGIWLADVEFCTAGLDLQMPADGSGGFTLSFAGACAQPLLLGTKDPGSTGGVGTAPFSQGPVHYDDVAPPDGKIDPATECFDYSFGECVDPMGTAITFFRNNPCADYVCADANCSGTVDAEDIDPFFIGLGDAGIWADMFPLCDFLCALDVNESGGVDGEDIDAFFAAIGLGFCP